MCQHDQKDVSEVSLSKKSQYLLEINEDFEGKHPVSGKQGKVDDSQEEMHANSKEDSGLLDVKKNAEDKRAGLEIH